MRFMLAQSPAQVPVKYVSVQCKWGLSSVLYGSIYGGLSSVLYGSIYGGKKCDSLLDPPDNPDVEEGGAS